MPRLLQALPDHCLLFRLLLHMEQVKSCLSDMPMFEMTRRKQKRVLSANLGYVSLHQDAFHLLLLHKHLPHLLLILAHDTFHLLLLVKHALHCPLWRLWLHRRRLRDLRNLHTLHVEKPLHMKCWQLRADSRLARACEILPECLLTTASRRRPQPWTPLTLSASICAHHIKLA